MADILAFRPRLVPAPPLAAPEARAELRRQLERAAEFALDIVHQIVAALDEIDGDPDLEPDPVEDDGTAEPGLAALVTGLTQVRWAGFDDVPGGLPA